MVDTVIRGSISGVVGIGSTGSSDGTSVFIMIYIKVAIIKSATLENNTENPAAGRPVSVVSEENPVNVIRMFKTNVPANVITTAS